MKEQEESEKKSARKELSKTIYNKWINDRYQK